MLNLQFRLMSIALRTWSRIPLAAHAGTLPADHPEWLAHSARHAPLVGVLVAVPSAVAYAIAGLWLPHAVALLAAIAIMMLLTAAMHEREFVAACDAFEAPTGHPAARAPVRHGALALVAMLLLMLTRLETLSSIDPSWIGVALVCAAAWSRGCAVIGAAFGAPAGASAGTGPSGDGSAGTGSSDDHAWAVKGSSGDDASAGTRPSGDGASAGVVTSGVAMRSAVPPRGADLGVAAAWSVAPLLAATAWTGDSHVFVTAAALGALAAWVVVRLVRRRPGVRPAEAFGMTQQLAELAFFLGVLATLSIADETLADSPP